MVKYVYININFVFQVKYERLRTSIKEAMTLNSPTPDLCRQMSQAILSPTGSEPKSEAGSVSHVEEINE